MSQLFDVVIIGSGLAGMSCALSLGEQYKIALISKGGLISGSSDLAQGGIAAVMDSDDNFENHIRDTFIAGAELGEFEAIRHIITNAPASIEWLMTQGVQFTMEDDDASKLHLTREGGHSHRRVVHADDLTGHAIQVALAERVREHSNIQVFENVIAVDLITDKHKRQIQQKSKDARCYGVYIQHRETHQISSIQARFTVLATGGAGKVYKVTTNPDSNSGDGIAMAWRAGCRVVNMEFMQFHPTCLYHPHAKSFLISEALRGEGGILRLPSKDGQPGYRFMFDHDERGELAPRDIVARAIDFEMKKNGIECVYLDMTHLPAEFLHEHFPNINAKCLELGIDMTQQPIPVAPGAHYTCGGVATDLAGRTDIQNLYAIGEVTYTGLHGANRLASNSLLECVVMGKSVSDNIKEVAAKNFAYKAPDLLEWDASRVIPSDEAVMITHSWDALRQAMWNYVGIVRSNKRLEQAEKRVRLLKQEVNDYYTQYQITPDLVELRNLVTCAELIINSASFRHESRGLHYSLDYKRELPKALPTILTPKN